MGHSTERIDWRQKAFNMMDEGLVTADFMAAMLIQWLTSDDIYECLDANELTPRFFGDVE
jgi:hypothetical protein